jgi:hypothetical protein
MKSGELNISRRRMKKDEFINITVNHTSGQSYFSVLKRTAISKLTELLSLTKINSGMGRSMFNVKVEKSLLSVKQSNKYHTSYI